MLPTPSKWRDPALPRSPDWGRPAAKARLLAQHQLAVATPLGQSWRRAASALSTPVGTAAPRIPGLMNAPATCSLERTSRAAPPMATPHD